MKFVSQKYPQLRVSTIDVRFVDGVAETTEEHAIEVLLKMSETGVFPENPVDEGAQKRSRSRKRVQETEE